MFYFLEKIEIAELKASFLGLGGWRNLIAWKWTAIGESHFSKLKIESTRSGRVSHRDWNLACPNCCGAGLSGSSSENLVTFFSFQGSIKLSIQSLQLKYGRTRIRNLRNECSLSFPFLSSCKEEKSESSKGRKSLKLSFSSKSEIQIGHR